MLPVSLNSSLPNILHNRATGEITKKNNKPVATKTSESKVSQPPFINPINADNRYMIETPILLGFDDLVYT